MKFIHGVNFIVDGCVLVELEGYAHRLDTYFARRMQTTNIPLSPLHLHPS
jgi:hypothetical protein